MEHAEKHVEHAEKHVEHAGTGIRPHKPRWQADQQHNINRTGTLLLMAEEKARGSFVITVLTCAIGMNDTLTSIKELPFSCFPSLKEG